MKRIKTRAWIAAVATLAGCGQSQSHQVAETSAEKGRPETTATVGKPIELFDDAKAFSVTFISTPGPIEASRPFALNVCVTRLPSNKRIGNDISLVVDAAMPQHRHGMNTQPRVRRIGPGRFEVQGMLLHMPGRWEIYFDIVEGAVTRRATYVLELE